MTDEKETTLVWGICEVVLDEERVEDTPVNYVYVVRFHARHCGFCFFTVELCCHDSC